MTFEESTVIDGPAADVFSLSQDYARRLEWDPFLRSAALVDGASEPGVGARAVCIARTGWAMETEYISFNPPRSTAVKMIRGPWFLDGFADPRFEPIEPGRTLVEFRYGLQARPRWLARPLNPILAWSFTRDTRARLRAPKEAVERGGTSSRAKAEE